MGDNKFQIIVHVRPTPCPVRISKSSCEDIARTGTCVVSRAIRRLETKFGSVMWFDKWKMLFNFGKCKFLHPGHGNNSMNYTMGSTILSEAEKEKYLGVTINCTLIVSPE